MNRSGGNLQNRAYEKLYLNVRALLSGETMLYKVVNTYDPLEAGRHGA